MKKTVIAMSVVSALASPLPVFAASFVNGAFEDGNTNGWAVAGSTRRNTILNSALTPAFVIANADNGGVHSAIIDNTSGYIDPNVAAADLGTTVYSGRYSYRVEDTTSGGYASLIQQTVLNYTDPEIFFAWKAVLEAAHTTESAAVMKIVLRDITASVDLITRTYTAVGSGVDSKFSLNAGGFYYTPTWQIEQLTLGAGQIGHDFSLSVLASDCNPTGHAGYVYLDGFGAAPPPRDGVPEPASLALLGLGLASLAVSRRRKSV